MAAWLKNKVRAVYDHLPLSPTTKRFLREKIYAVRNITAQLYLAVLKPHCHLSVTASNLPDVLIFASIDWSFCTQRPQHMARKLAEKGYRVFYFSNIFHIRKTPGFTAQKLDNKLPLYNITLFCDHSISFYNHDLNPDEFQQLKQGLEDFLSWKRSQKTLSLVEHAFWTDLTFTIPNNRVIYDCLDHHAGFGNVDLPMIQKEKKLFKLAALVLASSQKLYEEATHHNTHVALIRNATDYDHFKCSPSKIYTDPKKQKILGYYGAIADWFDSEIFEKFAIACPHETILLIGNDSIHVAQKLKKYRNIIFTGEVSYGKLPYYLHAFDVCLIPFKINPLTEATNPVKVYEYLSAGKPVVSVDLPEVRMLSDYVDIATSHDEFISKVKYRLNQPGHPNPRQEFASQQTWAARIESFEKTLKELN